MKIKDLKTNHITNPLGFKLDTISLSWITEDTISKSQTAVMWLSVRGLLKINSIDL